MTDTYNGHDITRALLAHNITREESAEILALAKPIPPEDYNGWTNKPTWLVKFWIDNDQGEQEFWLDTARDVQRQPFAPFYKGQSRERHEEHQLATILKDSFEEQADDQIGNAGLLSDLMSWALAMVNWDEIAKSLIEDAAEVEV